MKTFTDYFNDTDREYSYTVKLACDVVSPDGISAIEESLHVQELNKLSKFTGSPLQENPLDFPNIHNSSVHVADFTIKYPASTDMLERVISEALGIQRNCVVVYTENDPRKAYTEQYLERNDPAFKENYEPVMGSEVDPAENPDTPKYGADYNVEMLDELTRKRDKRKTATYTNKLIPDAVTDTAPKSDMGPIGTTSPFTPETRG